MDRRKFLFSGLALAAFPLSAAAEVRYNFQGRSWVTAPARPATPPPATWGQTQAAAWGGAQHRNWRSQRTGYSGKQIIAYDTREKPGTVIIDTSKRRLFYVLGDGQAISYGVGVGRQGFQWSGVARVGMKREWPEWRPPAEMIERELAQYGRRLPSVVEGGPANPLGARALYLFQGGRDTLYRIHGTNQPHTIGQAMSSGCIRMLNEEVIDLYDRVKMGAKVIVL